MKMHLKYGWRNRHSDGRRRSFHLANLKNGRVAIASGPVVDGFIQVDTIDEIDAEMLNSKHPKYVRDQPVIMYNINIPAYVVVHRYNAFTVLVDVQYVMWVQANVDKFNQHLLNVTINEPQPPADPVRQKRKKSDGDSKHWFTKLCEFMGVVCD